jgi:hypothetical protein
MPTDNDSPKNKAKIIAIDRKGKVLNTFSVPYNPNKYSISKRSNFKSGTSTTSDDPDQQYVGGGESVLNMELFFDTYGQRTEASQTYKDVRTLIGPLRKLLYIYPDDHEPMRCTVSWGSLSFDGYLSDLTENYIMFANDGTPVRATVTVKFVSHTAKKDQMKAASMQSADRTKERVLKDGDHLWAIADREYDNPAMWRVIAEANGIDNPRKLKSGQSIIVPSLE